MTKITCKAWDCIYQVDGKCTAEEIIISGPYGLDQYGHQKRVNECRQYIVSPWWTHLEEPMMELYNHFNKKDHRNRPEAFK